MHSSALRLLTLLAISFASCSRDDSTEPTYPIRFFPQKPRGKVLCDESIADPAAAKDWHVLVKSSSGAELLPMGHATNTRSAAAGMPVAFVRVFELPAHSDTEALARFRFSGARPSGECSSFYVLELPHDAGSFSSVVERAYAGLDLRDTQKRSTWLDDLDADHAAVAYISIDPAPFGRRMLATFPITDQNVQMIGFQVREKESRSAATGTQRVNLAAANVPLDRRVQTFRLADDVRRCILVRPSGDFVFEHEPIDAALRFEVGIAAEANAGRRQVTTLTLECETGPDVWVRVGERALENPGVRHPYFDSFIVDLPARASSAQSIRIRARTTGECGVLLAEPMLRPAARKDPRRKNLLLVSLDTLRQDTLGCYGYSRPTTPFLDSLAARGARFASVTSVAPYTLPTHASLLTGLFPARHGAVHPVDRFVAERVEYLPRLLRRAGYHTAAFTGGGYVSDAFGFDAGFDRFSIADPLRAVDDGLATADPATQEFRKLYGFDGVADWIESRGNEPWFLFLHTFMVHEYDAPAADLALFDSKPTTTPGRKFPDYLVRDEWRTQPPSPGDVQHLRDRYDATVHYADRRLAALFARLEASGSLRDTVVVVLSDHGEEFFEHRSLRHSVTLYEELVQVPWILVGPDVPSNLVVSEPVSQTDVFPTLLDLLGLAIPDGLDGHTRLPALAGKRDAFVETPLYSQIAAPHSRRTALRLGPWKTIRSEAVAAPLTEVEVAPAELFDLRVDRGELSNVFEEKTLEAKRMHSALLAVEKYFSTLALGRREAAMDPELEARLRQLGYLR